jgi:hypothetical protein
MSRICHEHCPTSEVSGGFWLVVLVGAAGGVVWLLGHLLTGLGKTTMTVIAGTALVTVGLVLVLAVRTAVRNSTGIASTAEPVTESHPVGEGVSHDTEPGSGAAWPGDKPAVQGVSAGRPRFRLIRGGRAA